MAFSAILLQLFWQKCYRNVSWVVKYKINTNNFIQQKHYNA